MSGIFEHLAATDDSHIVATRKASAVAAKRVNDRFSKFFANANADDFSHRVALVEDDIAQIVDDVVAEHGGDAEKVTAAIKKSLDMMAPGAPGAMGAPMGAPSVPGGPAGMPSAPSGPTGGQTCPKCGQPAPGGACPACTAQAGQAPVAPLPTGGPGAAGPGALPGQPVTAAGGFCDDCRKWKSGPKAGCTCGDSDSDSDSGDDDVQEKEARVALNLATQPIMHPQSLPDEPGEGVTDIDGELAEAPSAVGKGAQAVASIKEAEALKTVKLPKADESGLGGPSPKIDKSKSGDERGWTLDDIDTQMQGSPNPTVQQDPTDKADYGNRDFLDQTGEGVREQVELDTADDFSSGFGTGGEAYGPHTDTWSGTDGQANPVTSAVDPDKNPLREIIESQYDGFLPSTQVQSAIREWEVG